MQQRHLYMPEWEQYLHHELPREDLPREEQPAAWRTKAHRLIARMCSASYRQSNPKPHKQHRPYSVPVLAEELIHCLNTDDEERAKRLFLDYDGYADEYKR